jgi:hypothetical protein
MQPSKPMAEIVEYYAPDRETRIFACHYGWSGTLKDMSLGIYGVLVDHSCPTCEKMLFIGGYPSLSGTREAAARGDEEAIRALPS